jgi:hypothetical protein
MTKLTVLITGARTGIGRSGRHRLRSERLPDCYLGPQ